MLTSEQKAAIEQRRLKALQLRLVREQDQLTPPPAPPPAPPPQVPLANTKKRSRTTQHIENEVCESDSSDSSDSLDSCSDSYNSSNKTKKKKNQNQNQNKLVTRAFALSHYLIPSSSLEVLPVMSSKPNPTNSSFKPMKLYSRSLVRARSYKRWGGRKELKAERNRRELGSFDRKRKEAEAAMR